MKTIITIAIMLVSIMYGYGNSKACDKTDKVLCIPYDSYEVSDWERLRSNYFKYSILREEVQKEIENIGELPELDLEKYIDREAMVLSFINGGSMDDLIFKSKEHELALAREIIAGQDYNRTKRQSRIQVEKV